MKHQIENLISEMFSIRAFGAKFVFSKQSVSYDPGYFVEPDGLKSLPKTPLQTDRRAFSQ